MFTIFRKMAASSGGEDDNPFLFSKFLKKTPDLYHNPAEQTSILDLDDNDETLPMPSPGEPEEKQEEFIDVKDHNDAKQYVENFMKGSKKVGKGPRVLQIVNDEVHQIPKEKLRNVLTQNSSSHNGPLSLSDSDIEDDDSSDCSSPLTEAYIVATGNRRTKSEDELQQKIEKLEKENKKLKETVEKLRKEAAEESEKHKSKLKSVKKEMEIARRKEAEETAALEEVVQMVEQNLEKSTQRALKAEATVSRLKDEIKFMKEDSVPRSVYNRLLEEHEFMKETVRDKSKHAAKLMRNAADKAEPSIKELQHGITSLRFIADQFDEIDKIADVKPSRDQTV